MKVDPELMASMEIIKALVTKNTNFIEKKHHRLAEI